MPDNSAVDEGEDRRCHRCRRLLKNHGKAWLDGHVKHYICPSTKGQALGEA